MEVESAAFVESSPAPAPIPMAAAAVAAEPLPAAPVSTCLTSSLLCSLFPRESKAGFVRSMDLSKEFGSSDYPLLNFMLRNVTAGIVSTAAPAPLAMDPVTAQGGLLYMYDASFGGGGGGGGGAAGNGDGLQQQQQQQRGYLQDGIVWRVSKMAIKLIVFSEAHKNRFKLKNQRGESGIPVMRRQTWQSVSGGWRRHEYRLIVQELSYNPQPDGSLKTTQTSVLQNFPCLVHYFLKKQQRPAVQMDPAGGLPVHKRRASASSSSSASCSGSSDAEASADSSSDHKVPIQQQQQQQQFSVPMALAAFSTADQQDQHMSDFPQLQPPPPAAISPATAALFQAMGESMGMGAGEMGILGEMPESPQFRQQQQQQSQEPLPPISSPSLGPLGSLPMTMESLTDAAVAQVETREYVQVKSYAPEVGPCSERTRVLVVVEAFAGAGLCNVFFDGSVVQAQEICGGCFEFMTPQRSAGCIALFWLTRAASAGAEDPPVSTNAMPFCMAPCDDRGHLSLAANDFLTNPISGVVVHKFRHVIRELDMSHNTLTDVSFLEGFYQLSTLILDANKLTSASRFPKLPRLRTLTLNSNKIADLALAVDTLAKCFPGLQYLSMLDNPACPFFMAQPHHYYNYRIYILSRMPQLTQLDSSPITPEERRHAASITEAQEQQTAAVHPALLQPQQQPQQQQQQQQQSQQRHHRPKPARAWPSVFRSNPAQHQLQQQRK